MRCKPLCMEGFAPYAGDGVVETPRPCFYASTTLSTLFPGLQPLWGRFLFCVAECRGRRKGGFPSAPVFLLPQWGTSPSGCCLRSAFHRFAVPLLGPILKGQCLCFRRGPGSKPRSLPCLSLGQQRGTIKQRY